MPGHPHDPPFPAALPTPEPILPSIEALVRQRASELVPTPKPRRRLVLASSVGSLAVAACCAVLIMVLGSSSSSGWLSPQRAVAAMADTLDGNGILHWKWRGDLVETPEQFERPGVEVVEAWIDLESGESRRVTTKIPADGSPLETLRTWATPDARWTEMPSASDGARSIKRFDRHPGGPDPTGDAEVLEVLDRARRGEATISTGGEDSGVPLVLITYRSEAFTRRLWITRETTPRVVRSTTEVPARRNRPAATIESRTETWEVLPRSAANLAQVALPPDVQKAP